MMETYLNKLVQCRCNIPWSYVKKGKKLLPTKMKHFCAWRLEQLSSCLVEGEDLVASFLTEEAIRSAVVEAAIRKTLPHLLPVIGYGRINAKGHTTSVIAV